MRMLVPIDGSEHSWDALAYTVEQSPDSLVLFHVINPMTSVQTDGIYLTHDDFVAAGQEQAETLFEQAADIIGDANIAVETDTAVGTPAREIVRYTEADDNGIDHIVLGSQGRSGVARVVLGSVAESVARRSPVPVTIVR